MQPGASFPTIFTKKDLRCFYDLMHRPEATHASVLSGHFTRTKQAMNTPEVILIVHDTTELDFTSHEALRDQLGPIGNGTRRGLLQHNSLAVRANDHVLLGLAHQQLVLRKPEPPNETRTQRKNRPRESDLWKQGFNGVGRPPEGCVWVDVCDRGGDIFEALHVAIKLGHEALIRACQDRCIQFTQPDGTHSAKLMEFARSLPGQVSDTVQVTQKGGRAARKATVQLAAAEIRIDPPKQLPNRENYESLRVWVVRIWEANPPTNTLGLEWVILSTLPTKTDEELRTRRDWYELRWPIAEDYHQAEKTGCSEEDVRFQDLATLSPSLALLSVVAVRLVQLRQTARAYPDEPATQVASELEVAMLQQALGVVTAVCTVRQFVRAMAKLGGFLGRKCDREPGWKTIWRGYHKLQLLVQGAQLHQQLLQQQQKPP